MCVFSRSPVETLAPSARRSIAFSPAMPMPRSTHWLAHPAFSDAVAHFLDNEKNHIHAYVDELREHNPFKE